MRQDLNKVIVDTGRFGSSYYKSRKWGRRPANVPVEDLPQKLPIKSGHAKDKEFSDRLGPLHRWLHSRVGKKWDDIFSDLCRLYPQKQFMNRHFFEHVGWSVYRIHRTPDGVLRASSLDSGSLWLLAEQLGPDDLYLDEEGVLRRGAPSQGPTKKERRERYEAEKALTYRPIDKNSCYAKIAGIWYHCQIATEVMAEYNSRYQRMKKAGLILKQSFVKRVIVKYPAPPRASLCYQVEYVSSRRQLGKKELKKLNATNG